MVHIKSKKSKMSGIIIIFAKSEWAERHISEIFILRKWFFKKCISSFIKNISIFMKKHLDSIHKLFFNAIEMFFHECPNVFSLMRILFSKNHFLNFFLLRICLSAHPNARVFYRFNHTHTKSRSKTRIDCQLTGKNFH